MNQRRFAFRLAVIAALAWALVWLASLFLSPQGL